MGKPRVEQYRFRVPLYSARILLVRSTPQDFLRVLADHVAGEDVEKHRPTGDGATFLLTHPDHPAMMVIWLDAPAILSDPHWIGTLAHECWHAVWRLSQKIGLPANNADESAGEAHAYLHGWLVEQCVTRLQRRSRRALAGRRKK